MAHLLFLPFIIYFGIRAVLADVSGNRRQLMLYKPLTTILILLLAGSSFILSAPDPVFAGMVVAALVFSLGGDIALMFPGDKTFLLGLVSFLIAHIIYGVAFVLVSPFVKSDLLLALILLVIAAGMYSFLFKGLGAMKIPVALYLLIIAFMVFKAFSILLGRHFSLPAGIILAAGASLFFISDSILAADKFRIKIPKNGWYILTTYYAGQTLLALSTYYLLN